MFNKQFAANYITDLCKKHKIKVIKWRSSSCGCAFRKRREIEIPKPTNVDRFAVCLHEIFHIAKPKGSQQFEKEFYCDKYALDVLIELKYPTEDWIRRMKWHIIRCLAMAHNRGLNHTKISQEVRDFFPEIDFNTWIGNKVFAGRPYYDNPIPANIELSKSMNREEIETILTRKGLILEKSSCDDSTYGQWLINGTSFASLSEIVNHYNL